MRGRVVYAGRPEEVTHPEGNGKNRASYSDNKYGGATMHKGLAAIAVLAVALAGCAGARGPTRGGHLQFSDGGISTTANAGDLSRFRTGEASCYSFMGIFAGGDCTILTAARNAGITEIVHVDAETISVLGLYATFKTIVYGK